MLKFMVGNFVHLWSWLVYASQVTCKEHKCAVHIWLFEHYGVSELI